MKAGALAYTNVRVHAARERVISDATLARLRAAPSADALARLLGELELGDGSAREAFRSLFARLMADYARILRSLPGDAAPLLALAGRFDVENLKLVYRAVVRGASAARWRELWLPVGAAGSLERDRWLDVHTLAELADRTRRTPYEAAGLALAREGGHDPAAAELGLDRFASRRLLAAARRGDTETAALLLAVVRERDAEVLRRAPAYGLDAGAAAAWLAGEPPVEPPERLRAERRRLARRAFVGSPLRAAPAVALLLEEEERLGEVVAIAEGRGPPC